MSVSLVTNNFPISLPTAQWNKIAVPHKLLLFYLYVLMIVIYEDDLNIHYFPKLFNLSSQRHSLSFFVLLTKLACL